jgi:hypothetical protein
MTARILQINMKFNMTRAEYEETVAPVVDSIAAVPGLRWKVWIMNEAEQETGGIYLFDDEASVNAYLQGPIVSAVAKHPNLSDFSVKQFEVMEGLTSITRGPLGETVGS